MKLYKIKTIKDALKFSSCKDENRPSIIGYHHNDSIKSVVSTNGYVMTVSKSLYDEKLKGLTVMPDAISLNPSSFPDFISLINSKDNSEIKEAKVNIMKMFSVKMKGQVIPVHFNMKENGEIVSSFQRKKETLFTINSKFLSPLADGVTRYVRWKDACGTVYFSLFDDNKFEDFMVIMPIKLQESEGWD